MKPWGNSSFVKAPCSVVFSEKLTCAEKILWLAVHLHARNGHKCTAGIGKLSTLTGMSRRHIKDLLKGLEEKGFLQREFKPGCTTRLTPINPGTLVPHQGGTQPSRFKADRGTVPPGVGNHSSRGWGTTVHPNRYILIDERIDVQEPPSPSVPVVEVAPKSKSRKTKRAAKPTDPRIADIMAFYHDEHLRVLDEKPHIIGGRDASVIKRILQTIPDVDEIKSRITAFIADPLSWMDTPNHSLALFEKRINAYSPYNRAKHSTSAIDEWLNEPDETLQ